MLEVSKSCVWSITPALLTVVRAGICHLSHMAFGKVSETDTERWILLFPGRDDSV